MTKESPTMILDYRLYREAGILSKRIIKPKEEEGPEFYLLYSAKDLLDELGEVIKEKGTELSLEEFCLLKAVRDNMKAICNRTFKNGVPGYLKELLHGSKPYPGPKF